MGIINYFCLSTLLDSECIALSQEQFITLLKFKSQSEVSGLAVDWLGRNLYWADEGLEAVLVTRLEGPGERLQTTLVSNISQPRSVAVDPLNGFLFWSNWKTSENSLDSPGSIR